MIGPRLGELRSVNDADAGDRLGEDLDSYRPAALLEAEVDGVWRVLDFVLEVVTRWRTAKAFCCARGGLIVPGEGS